MSNAIPPAGGAPDTSATDPGLKAPAMPKIEEIPPTPVNGEKAADGRKCTDGGTPAPSEKPADGEKSVGEQPPVVTVTQPPGGSVTGEASQPGESTGSGVLSQLRATYRRRSRAAAGPQQQTEEKAKEKPSESRTSQEAKSPVVGVPKPEATALLPKVPRILHSIYHNSLYPWFE